jgi:ABC-type multidrug transport system fused ATPase/permease subunit
MKTLLFLLILLLSWIEQSSVKNINFEIQPGKTAAFVGATGAGKSTLSRLLFRFYDPCKGSIYIDGINTKISIKPG